MFCYKDQWFVVPSPQTRQVQQVRWSMVLNGKTENEANREWFNKERKIASLLYPLLDKDTVKFDKTTLK
jgi:hypothetical protein